MKPLRPLLMALAATAALLAEGVIPAGRFLFQNYAPGQGRSLPAVMALAQDGDGRLWIGTQEGILRFDGRSWLRFGPAEGLSSPNIRYMDSTSGGTVWALTADSPCWWDGQRFRRAAELGLPPGFGDALVQDPTGVYVCLHNEFWRAPHGGRFSRLEGSPKGRVTAGWSAPDGSLQYFTLVDPQGTQRLVRRGQGAWSDLALPKGTTEVQGILQDRRGRLWLRTQDTILRAPGYGGPWKNLGRHLVGSVLTTSYLPIQEDGEGRIWFSDGQKLLAFGEGDRPDLLGEAQGLDISQITTFLLDREGSLWVGGSGISRLLGGLRVVNHTRKEGLPDNLIWMVTGTRDGRILAGTGSGLALLEGDRWRTFPETAGLPFQALLEDRAGRLWAGAGLHRPGHSPILCLRPGGHRFEEVPLPWNDPAFTVASLAEDSEGRIWMAAFTAGIARLSPEGTRAERLPPPPGIQNWSMVTCLLPDAKGGMWAAGDLLAHWNGHSWAFVGRKLGLEEPRILGFAQGTGAAPEFFPMDIPGLQQARRTTTGLELLPLRREPPVLLGSILYAALREPEGSLWTGSSQGLTHWDGRRFRRVGKAEGMAAEDIAGSSLWRSPQGALWVGTTGGLVQLLPGAGTESGTQALPLLAGIQDGQGRALDGISSPRIPYRARTLTFRLGQTTFAQNERLILEVRMRGLEEAWHPLEGAEARYPALPTGGYTFEARLVDLAGRPGPVIAFPLEVLPAWWATWWARLLWGTAIGALVLLVVRWRTRLLSARAEELEHKVAERTLALAEANARLEDASLHDPLTGLHNRRFLGLTMPEEEARVRRAFHGAHNPKARERKEDLLFFILDLDHFKRVNDTHGHPAGDAVLCQTAARLSQTCRESDSVIRWGGEEFLILAKRTDRTAGGVIAENLRRVIEDSPFRLPGGQEVSCTCSIGFAAFPVLDSAPEAVSWEHVLDLADQCLYAAKRSGRNAWAGCSVDQELTGERVAAMVLQLQSRLGELAKNGEVLIESSLDPVTLSWN